MGLIPNLDLDLSQRSTSNSQTSTDNATRFGNYGVTTPGASLSNATMFIVGGVLLAFGVIAAFLWRR